MIKLAPDLSNRIDTIRFEVEPESKIQELIARGEAALNVSILARDEIARSAQGSFYLAQMLGYEECIAADVLERPEPSVCVNRPFSAVRQEVMERQERRFGDAVRQFARGTKFRPSGRAPYFHILTWLTEADAWSIVLREEMARHPKERASVGQVVEKGYLKNLVELPAIGDILHYDPSTRVLSVEDPHLIFYLRNLDLGQFARQAGFTNLAFSTNYDIALSFAGEDRGFASRLFEELEALGLAVFYDSNEQHRIIGENIEEFLKPIYESDAEYVVAILGRDYGQRRWTRFESAAFEQRFGENRVIPVWSVNARPTAFDKTAEIGGLSYDPDGDLGGQAKPIAEACSRKLDELRSESASTRSVEQLSLPGAHSHRQQA